MFDSCYDSPTNQSIQEEFVPGEIHDEALEEVYKIKKKIKIISTPMEQYKHDAVEYEKGVEALRKPRRSGFTVSLIWWECLRFTCNEGVEEPVQELMVSMERLQLEYKNAKENESFLNEKYQKQNEEMILYRSENEKFHKVVNTLSVKENIIRNAFSRLVEASK